MSLAPGVRLGAYEVVALIGAGGMGEVYRARDTRLGRDVAIKVIPPAFARGWAVSAFTDRTHNMRRRSAPKPTNARRFPSGDNANSRDGA